MSNAAEAGLHLWAAIAVSRGTGYDTAGLRPRTPRCSVSLAGTFSQGIVTQDELEGRRDHSTD
jgi:hypothetical protein